MKRIHVGVISNVNSLGNVRVPPYITNIKENLKTKQATTLFEVLSTSFQNHPVSFIPISSESLQKSEGESEVDFKLIEILIADPPLILSNIEKFQNLKWFCSTYAGVNSIVNEKVNKKDFILTRLGGVFGRPIAEYVIGQIISNERCFESYRSQQHAKIWQKSSHYRTLNNLHVAILGGMGDIGTHIAKYSKAMGMRVSAFSRTPKHNSTDGFFDRLVVGKDEFRKFLVEEKGVDFLVNILPSTPATKGLLDDRDLLQELNGCVFINVGRGDVISESILLEALDKKWLRHAVLDVFIEEPLPQTSPLWERSEVTITPHVSGSTFAEDVVDCFKENLELYLKGLPLKYVLDWEKGY